MPPVFWHIGAFEERAERLEAIVGRQLELLESSGLLREAHVYVGVVGPARPPALRRLLANPHVTVAARNGTGHECVTASALWRWALGQSCPSTWWPLSAGRSPVQYVLYMHSRGLRHSAACHYSNASSGHCAEDWTRTMEHFTIVHWRAAIGAMEHSGALTAGLELFPHPARIARRRTGWKDVFHYSGNFWWARPTYLARLPDPVKAARGGQDRHECCED